MNIRAFLTCSLFLVFSAVSAGAEQAPGADLRAERLKPQPAQAGVDFETYQRNVDEIMRISLMTRPNIDSGLNNVIVELNRQIEADPNNPNSLMSLGHVYRLIGQPSEANRFYEKALKLDPDNVRFLLFSALTHAEDENLGRALQNLEKAIRLNPSDIYARMARGQVLLMTGREADAAENFEKILQLDPGNRQAAFALSIARQLLGENDRALEILDRLRKENPDDPFVRYHLGALYFAKHDTAKAVDYWEGLFADGIRDTQFLYNLAVAYLEGGDDGRAENILGHLNFFFPHQDDVEFLLAETYRKMRLPQKAEAFYRYVLAENPGYLSASLGLAQVLELQGNFEERDRVLEQAADARKSLELKAPPKISGELNPRAVIDSARESVSRREEEQT